MFERLDDVNTLALEYVDVFVRVPLVWFDVVTTKGHSPAQ